MRYLLKFNPIARIGFRLLFFAWLFLFAIVLDLVWENNILFQYFFTPIGNFWAILVILPCVAMPGLAVLLNLFWVLRIRLYIKGEYIRFKLQIRMNFFNWLVIAVGGVSTSLVFGYLALQNQYGMRFVLEKILTKLPII